MEPPSLRLALALLGVLATGGSAGFITDFSTLVEGSRVDLKWSAVDAANLPLVIQGRFFNDTGKGVNSIIKNITADLRGTSFSWTNVPFPLPYIPTSQYEIQLLPQNWDVAAKGEAPVLGNSGLFSIKDTTNTRGGGGGIAQPPFGTEQATPQSAPSQQNTTTIIIGVCVGLGIPILIILGVVLWCMKRQKRKIAEKERRRRRFETVIH